MIKLNKKHKILYIVFIIIACVYLLLWLLIRPNKELDSQTIESHSGFLTKAPTERVGKNILKKNEKRYTVSFSDIFSGQAWLDNQQTNLFWDYSMMALTFEPKYKLRLNGDCQNNQEQCQAIADFVLPKKSCLNSNCLELYEDSLNYNGQQLNLPEKGEIVNLAFGLTNDRWLIAGVKKVSNQQYQPLAWWFDGYDFQSIELPNSKNKTSLTEYFGRLAIGVSKESALILYSSYEGRAWQINNQEIRDLSHLFGVRINNGGFWPKIISSGNGNATNWYIFDQSGLNLVFLKFWQNGTPWIEGGVSLAGYLPKDSQVAYFFPDKEEMSLLIKVINSAKQSKLWSFLDLGFNNDGAYQATSINLTDYDQKKKKIIVSLWKRGHL